MKIFFLLTASALSALSLVSAQFSIPLHRDAKGGNVNGTALLDREAKRVAAKYAKHAEVHFKRTGEHLGVVNDTTLNRRSDSGEVKLELADLNALVGEIEVGTPGQKKKVMFDTGSPDLVIGGDAYKPQDSSTSKDQHKKFNENYLDPEAKGSLYSYEVRVGGVKARNVVFGSTDFNFAAVTDHENLVGLFGLSFPTFSAFDTHKPHTFVELVKEQNSDYDNIFQFLLKKNDDAHINIGKIDESQVDGETAWVDVDSSDYHWKADIQINGIESSGIVDSGTRNIFGKNEDVKKVLDAIDGLEIKKSGSGDWQGWYNCDDPPEVNIMVAGKEVKMRQDAMFGGRNNGRCQMTIAGYQGVPEWVFGEPFLQTFSVIFDFDNERLGFGKLKY